MNDDPEIIALTSVYAALKDLDSAAQQRVLDFVARKLGLQHRQTVEGSRGSAGSIGDLQSVEPVPDTRGRLEEEHASDVEGISPVALKWMRRSGLTVKDLGNCSALVAMR